MSFDPNAYNVTVRRVTVDEQPVFEARVLELPDVRGYGDTATEAYDKAIEAIGALHEMAQSDHEEFPSPAEPEFEFSGRVTLRMPKSIHRLVATRAQEEDVSINTYILSALTVSLADAARTVTAGWSNAATTAMNVVEATGATGVAVSGNWSPYSLGYQSLAQTFGSGITAFTRGPQVGYYEQLAQVVAQGTTESAEGGMVIINITGSSGVAYGSGSTEDAAPESDVLIRHRPQPPEPKTRRRA